MEASGHSAERAARNQAVFRDVNERIRHMAETFEQLTPYGTWICECFNVECAERVEMTVGEYEALRKHPARFVVAPSEEHWDPAVERRVDGNARYWIVEKIGVAREVVEEFADR